MKNKDVSRTHVYTTCGAVLGYMQPVIYELYSNSTHLQIHNQSAGNGILSMFGGAMNIFGGMTKALHSVKSDNNNWLRNDVRDRLPEYVSIQLTLLNNYVCRIRVYPDKVTLIIKHNLSNIFELVIFNKHVSEYCELVYAYTSDGYYGMTTFCPTMRNRIKDDLQDKCIDKKQYAVFKNRHGK